MKNNRYNNIPKNVVIFLLIVLFGGCGFWTNFKTYFNTYYNANKIFEQTENKLLENREELFYFEEKTTPKNLASGFDDVIEKTSAILQHNKESAYVEEALLMTGKSFYYQQNYSRSLRKFNELASIPESELALENKLWIGKTYFQMRDFDKALKIIDEVKLEAIELEKNEILNEAYRIKIGYLLYTEDYKLATDEIQEFFDSDIDDELRAEVLFEMGRLYKLTEDYESAENAFARVENYSPTFEVDFNSKFEVAMLKGELGNVDESLNLLQVLRDEDKFEENWGDIDLEIGKIYYDRDEIGDALDKFTEVDTTYKKTEAAGVAGFYRAEILENNYQDYDSALVFYKTASTSLAPPSIRSSARKKSQLLEQYIRYHNTLENLRTQMLYLTDETAFMIDSIDYVEKVRQDSIKLASQVPEGRGETGRKTQNRTTHKKPTRPIISVDSLNSLNSKNYFELANLLFTEFDDPDSAYYYYDLSLKSNPDNPNEAQTFFSIGNYYLIKGEQEKADSIFTIVYDKFEFDPIRNEAAKKIGKPLYDFDKDPVEEKFVIAEEIYDSKKYDRAINTLFTIYKEHPNSIYASKSLYTIGFILENNLNLPDSAAAIYDIINAKYRTSEYAKAIQVKLTGYKREQIRIKAKQDSIKKATQNVEQLDATPEELNKIPEKLEEQSEKLDEKTENIIDEVPSNKLSENDDKIDSQIIEPKVEKIINNAQLNSDSGIVNSAKMNTKIEINSIKNTNDNFELVSKDIYKNEAGYFLQASLWKDKAEAYKHQDELKKKKYTAFVREVFVEELNSHYHKVFVGPYSSFNEVKTVKQKLNKS